MTRMSACRWICSMPAEATADTRRHPNSPQQSKTRNLHVAKLQHAERRSYRVKVCLGECHFTLATDSEKFARRFDKRALCVNRHICQSEGWALGRESRWASVKKLFTTSAAHATPKWAVAGNAVTRVLTT